MSQTFVFVGMTEVGSELAPNLLEAGFKAAENIAEADVIFTFTPFLDDTEELYFGSEGLITQAHEGAYLVNLSPATPSLSSEISALAQVSNMFAVDAPLLVKDASREHAFADRGNLAMFVGGEDEDAQSIKGLLDALVSDVVVCGAPGNGQLAKAAATLQRSAAVVGLIEAHSLCRVTSNEETAAALMARSMATGAVNSDIVNLYAAIVGRQFVSSYSAEIMLGEVVAALTAADDVELILPQAESAEYLFQMLCTIGGVGKSTASLSLLYADEAECARHGLDWSRAEQAYEAMDEDFEDHDHSHCDHDHDHHDHGHLGHGHHHHEEGFGFGAYSPN